MERPFFESVYEVVKRIPPGKVATYGLVAKLVGRPRAARHVGFAMRVAPEGLPCHRVVNHTGHLAPQDVFGSVDLQRHLLASEGIGFLPDGRIDLSKYLWNGEP